MKKMQHCKYIDINNIKLVKTLLKKIAMILLFYFIVLFEKILNSLFIKNHGIPKISIFLPIYNKSKYLKRSISSIQRQSIKDIEIIAVNDGSTDNTLEILNEMKGKDQRIKIVNNKENRGLLYSRAIGILNSKGDYLMNLDPDDEYNGRNNLKYLYYIAKKLKVDFITFFIFYLPSKEKSGQFSEFNKVLIQPELYESAFKNNYITDFYITNKFIKRGLLEKALHFFENEIYGEKWNYHEDNIWSILLHKYANSSIFINKNIYYYYYKNIDSEIFNRGNILELKNLLYRHNMYKKIFKKKSEEKYLISGYSELIEIFRNHKDILNKNKEFKKIWIKDLNDFQKNHNLTEEIKKNVDDLLKK